VPSSTVIGSVFVNGWWLWPAGISLSTAAAAVLL
jgi:hypothetical protein